MPTSIRRFIAGITLTTLVACGGPQTPPGTIASVHIDGGDRTIVVGDEVVLTATVVATGAAETGVAWASSDETVASIAADGRVTSHAAGTTDVTATSAADPTKSDRITLEVDPSGALRWTREFGTDVDDAGRGIAADASGNLFVAGYTDGAVEGFSAGMTDVFVRSYDGEGVLRWTRQFGTSGVEEAYGIAVDPSGNVYVAGFTSGALVGDSAGSLDAFIRSYDGDGVLRWTRQFGTDAIETALGIASDPSGNVYVSGYTFGALAGDNAGLRDGFVRSYDRDGTLRWTRQFGTEADDEAFGIATDADGNVYTAGYTDGALEGFGAGSLDAFIRSYDSEGTLRWTRQFGTDRTDEAFGVATDTSGNVYAAGHTTGSFPGDTNVGGRDAFVRSYDSAGDIRWTRQFGTSNDDGALGIATDASGNVYTTGFTFGVLIGSSAGFRDAFVRSYDGAGELRWTDQFGTVSVDEGYALATDSRGHTYATGYVRSAGSRDTFVRSYGR